MALLLPLLLPAGPFVSLWWCWHANYTVLLHVGPFLTVHVGVPLELELVVKQVKPDQSTCLIGFLDLALKIWVFQILPLVGISTEEKYVTG